MSTRQKNISNLFVIIVVIGLITVTGCVKDKGNDIANGSWGFISITGGLEFRFVYDFNGSPTEGDIYYINEKRGTYIVTDIVNVNFTVNHYDTEGNLFRYTYTGSFIDFYNMSGSFTINHPNGDITYGTWTAER